MSIRRRDEMGVSKRRTEWRPRHVRWQSGSHGRAAIGDLVKRLRMARAMNGVMIKDLESERRVLAVDLRHVLSALGARALASEWRVREVWAEGDAKPDLEAFDGSELISGQRLVALAQNVSQIIDGEFRAFESGQRLPWVVVEAVDSTYYAVRSEDPSVLAPVRSAFHDVTDYEHPVA
jgi:hypothetical protein